VDWQNGDLDAGFLVYGDQLSLGQGVSNEIHARECGTIKNATFIDFPMWIQHLTQLSNSLLNLTTTVSDVRIDGQDLEFTLPGTTGLFEVVSLTASQLLNTREIDIEQLHLLGHNSTLVFNVKGSPCGFQSIGFFGGLNREVAAQVLWNFPDCTDLVISSTTIRGTVLAPKAVCSANNGKIEGQLIGKSYNGDAEIDHVPFRGCGYLCQSNSTGTCA